ANARYTLTAATYEFRASEQGWELHKTQIECAIDNSRNRFDFNYVTDGRTYTIPAGGRASLSSNYPINIPFDNRQGPVVDRLLVGGGSAIVSQEDGTLKIACAQGR